MRISSQNEDSPSVSLRPIPSGILSVLSLSTQDDLEEAQTAEVPEHLAEVAEWIGASAIERGAALRDLLETFGRIAASRPPRRARPREPFPRFSSAETAAAS